jgi:hypothetical protein
MNQRAKESSVKNNMHTLQLTVEDNNGAYPGGYLVQTSETGETFVSLLPGGVHPNNPFTGAATVGLENAGVADPKTFSPVFANAGQYGYINDATNLTTRDGQRYAIKGCAADGTTELALILANY